MNLADTLHRDHLNVHPIDGWANRGRPGVFTPLGIVVHHTAGTDSLPTIVNGRADLPGPLAHLHITKGGRINLVAAGRANHAGRGSGLVLRAVERDIAPAAPAANLGLVDDTDGNRWFYGIEPENLGDGADPWPLPQIDAIVGCCAAICRAHAWTHNRVIGHLEWTRRKIDPTLSPRHLRDLVASRLAEPSLPPQPEDDNMPILFKKAGEPAVYVMTPRGPKPVPSAAARDQLQRGEVAELPAATFEEWIR